MKLRILQHERNTDNIRIGAAFYMNSRSMADIADEVKHSYGKRGADKLDEFLCKVAVVDANTLETLYIIYED
ncbi:MAG: hypothetical protein LBH06_07380 [Rikenellaceae bacterium]|jgi:hypothetical protein|nr:hypothetical protein [Rikenellaceae bacterium]